LPYSTQFLVNSKAIAASDIYDLIRERLGSSAAYTWLLSASAALGGKSPIQAIKEGREEEVRAAAAVIVSQSSQTSGAVCWSCE
jgi:hypothetical protein